MNYCKNCKNWKTKSRDFYEFMKKKLKIQEIVNM